MNSNFWDELISQLPNPHFLQSHEWGQVKAKYGWIPYYAIWSETGFQIVQNPESITNYQLPIATCLILKRTVSFRGLLKASVLYAPKGPLLDWTNESLRTRVLNDLQAFAKEQKAIFIKGGVLFLCKKTHGRILPDPPGWSGGTGEPSAAKAVPAMGFGMGGTPFLAEGSPVLPF